MPELKPTWIAFDLPDPKPVAANLSYEEMRRFEELGFHIERPAGSSPEDYDLIRLEEKRLQAVRTQRFRQAREKARARASRRNSKVSEVLNGSK